MSLGLKVVHQGTRAVSSALGDPPAQKADTSIRVALIELRSTSTHAR